MSSLQVKLKLAFVSHLGVKKEKRHIEHQRSLSISAMSKDNFTVLESREGFLLAKMNIKSLHKLGHGSHSCLFWFFP